jgi:hypothetical protein
MDAIWYRSRSRSDRDYMEQRKSQRRTTNFAALVLSEDGGSILAACRVLDISLSGARIKLDLPAELPQAFVLVLSRNGRTRRRCVLRWQNWPDCGVEFQ